MNKLEAKITALLIEIAPHIELIEQTYQKWVIIDDSRQQVKQFRDDRASISFSFQRSLKDIQSIESYDDTKIAFESDSVFGNSSRATGAWGTFNMILAHVISTGGVIRKGQITIDVALAISALKELRNLLTKQSLQFVARARLLGVQLKCKMIQLPEKVTLRRLTISEMNDRQPYISMFHSWQDQQTYSHRTEIEVNITMPIDQSSDAAHFNVANDVKRIASETIANLVYAIQLAFSGTCEVGPIVLSGGFLGSAAGSSMSQPSTFFHSIKIGIANIDRIKESHALVVGKKQNDKTLTRALQRFLLGKKRSAPLDRLVDFVVAWEAILLTNEGGSIDQELSYRFSINGTSLLNKLNKKSRAEENYSRFRCAYKARSITVHGGSDDKLDSELEKAGFNNINELNNYLEEQFRLVVFWLAKLKIQDRPYKASYGWESLLWYV